MYLKCAYFISNFMQCLQLLLQRKNIRKFKIERLFLKYLISTNYFLLLSMKLSSWEKWQKYNDNISDLKKKQMEKSKLKNLKWMGNSCHIPRVVQTFLYVEYTRLNLVSFLTRPYSCKTVACNSLKLTTFCEQNKHIW